MIDLECPNHVKEMIDMDKRYTEEELEDHIFWGGPVKQKFLDYYLKYMTVIGHDLIQYNNCYGDRFFFEPTLDEYGYKAYEFSFVIRQTEQTGWTSNDYRRTTRKL